MTTRSRSTGSTRTRSAATRSTTTTSTEGAPRLAEADIPQVLSILRQTDSVELKVTVAVDAHRATIRGMPIDPVEAQPRQVFFFDTPDLALDRAGVVLRARRIQGGRGDTVIKLRPVVPEQLSPQLRQLRSFNVELDVLPGGFVCSASFKGRTTGKRVRDAAHGTLPLRMLFSKWQRAIYGEHAPEGIGLDDLRVLGPTFVLKATFPSGVPESDGMTPRRMVAELWLYPDGSRILELSLKCLPLEAFHVAAETRVWLAAKGVGLGGGQQTKTRTALSFFASELAATPGGAS